MMYFLSLLLLGSKVAPARRMNHAWCKASNDYREVHRMQRGYWQTRVRITMEACACDAIPIQRWYVIKKKKKKRSIQK
jgi:hypothetical protein